jgi:F420-0:gamma-glutamyl ligase
VAAGMTGGLGYFYDEEGDFEDKVNAEIVTVQPVRTAAGEAQLRALLTDHVEKTGALPVADAHLRCQVVGMVQGTLCCSHIVPMSKAHVTVPLQHKAEALRYSIPICTCCDSH